MPGATYQLITLAQAKCLARPKYPSLIIGCGRRAARVSAEIRQRLGPTIRNIQILNPVTSPEKQLQMWDWLLIPEHDGIYGSNIINFHGALVNPPPVASSPTHLVILVGAPSKNLPWNRIDLELWLHQAKAQTKPVILCPSRRTTASILEQLQQAVRNNTDWKIVVANDYSEYQQALMLAAKFWVSGDSINMLAEACASTRPLRILGKKQAGGKLSRYFAKLDQLGRTTACTPLIEVTRVAEQLTRRGAIIP